MAAPTISVVPTSPASVKHDPANKGFKLEGDSASPGNFKYYGTNATGQKGYHSLPTTSGGGDGTPDGGEAGFGVTPLTVGDVTVQVHYIGPIAPTTFTGSPTAGYTLVVPGGSHVLWLDVYGNSTTTNSAGEFVLKVDNSANSYDRRFVLEINDLGPKQETDEEVRGHIMKEEVAGRVTTTTTPNIGGNYPGGFAAKFR